MLKTSSMVSSFSKLSSFCSISSSRRWCSSLPLGASDQPYSNNDIVAPRIRNRNPMNLEKMRIGRKPRGFQLDNNERQYWNKLQLDITNQHTTAVVKHWTGRIVAQASTQEAAIQKFLYNLTDQAALTAVGKVISQRCLETGVNEVFLELSEQDKAKEKMQKFVCVIEESGLSLQEGKWYQARNIHIVDHRQPQYKKVQPWTVIDE